FANFHVTQGPWTGGFWDVPASSPFREEIAWLSATGVTTGYPDGSFQPTTEVTRETMAAFLYRLAGSPATTTTVRFTDVPATHRFAREISWLADQGITTGFTDGKFRPGEAVSRAAMAAFLHRYAGSPSTTAASSTFRDMPAGAPFSQEVGWAAQTGITTGFTDGSFRPGDAISRQAMAAFLYRFDALAG
ncbi:hypothetical protein N866_05795, partial [Actinotalea ferrariae CF5-4]